MQIVSACLARDLPVYRVTFESLRKILPTAELNVITRKQDFDRFKRICGPDLHLWDESELIPEMTLAELKKLPLSFFPKGAGWYFQQFLKFAFINVSNSDEHFLIWDADTVLLRNIEFFDSTGKPYYTRAQEHHKPYFETFEKLFGTHPEREFSFISQHQIINKQILRQMLTEIEIRNPNEKNWAWAIMANLQGEGSNLFSEYETYGHYMKLKHTSSFVLRDLSWTRHGGGALGFRPWQWYQKQLKKRWDFAAFEANDQPLRGFARIIKNNLKKMKFGKSIDES